MTIDQYEDMWTSDRAKYALVKQGPAFRLQFRLVQREPPGVVVVDDERAVLEQLFAKMIEAGAEVLTEEEWDAYQAEFPLDDDL